jgi:exosome complex protein LRP1
MVWYDHRVLVHLSERTSPQTDNKTLSSNLAQKIAEERAKALLKSVENGGGKKRPAEEASTSAAKEDDKKSSKKHKSKGKNKSKR